jgi:hypothetical protein
VVISRLFCRDVAAETDFCKNTFGAVELGRRPGPDGIPAHALLAIGPAMIMIEAEWRGWRAVLPNRTGVGVAAVSLAQPAPGLPNHPMLPTGQDDEYEAIIPALDVDPKFDLMYLLEVTDNAGNGAIYRDLHSETPYVIVQVLAADRQ